MADPLPVDAVLPRLTAALRERSAAVLRAPPGAGKTTRVPPALLDAGLAGDGKVLVLEPRRIAARAAARRIASERGGEVGDEVGYRVRFDSRAGPATRIEIVTEGVYLRRLQADPFLGGVGAVVFDEFHERSLASDLALAMTRRVRDDVRPDLRIVVMSATIETDPVAGYLDAPAIECEGRLHPVSVKYLSSPDDRRIPDRAAAGVMRVLGATDGDVLCFLPGAGEIRGTADRLADLAAREGLAIAELYGDLPPDRQDEALRPGKSRKVVLATNVAETSVTVEGVGAVVDTGTAKVMRHDPSLGMEKLVLVRISRAAADQRAGRAGRTGPGVCLRLWTEREHRDLPERETPEVRRADLSGSALQLLAFGEPDLGEFPWFEEPDAGRLESALALLSELGAVRSGQITPVGRAMAELPLAPRLARLLVEGRERGVLPRAALAAALFSERDPFRGRTRPRRAPHRSVSDVLDRVECLEEHAASGRRSFDLGEISPGAARFLLRIRDQLVRLAGRKGGGQREDPDAALLRSLFVAFPDRLARRREEGGPRGVLVTGGGVRLDPRSAVMDPELFICVDVQGDRTEALVRAASGVRREWLPEEEIQEEIEVAFDADRERVVAVRRTRFRALVLSEHEGPPEDAARASEVLAAAAAERLDRAFDLGAPAVASLLARVSFLREEMPELGLPELGEDALRELLPALAAGRRSFAELRKAPLLDFLSARLGHGGRRALDEHAPERIRLPGGRRARLTWEAGRPPVLAVKIQELFGRAETPRVAAGRVPVLLHLLAPNGRPQQITDDLASFWKNTWPVVRKELRARYPKHAWPVTPPGRPEKG